MENYADILEEEAFVLMQDTPYTRALRQGAAAIRERDELRERIERACELAEKVGPYAKQVMWPVLKGEDK